MSGLERIADAATEVAERVSTRAEELSGQIRIAESRLMIRLRQQLGSHPVSSLGFAVLAGTLIGYIMSWRFPHAD